MIAMAVGMSLDVVIAYIHSLIHPFEVPENKLQVNCILFMLGLLQILLNAIALNMLFKYKLKSSTLVLGLFLPQSLIIGHVYGTSYVKTGLLPPSEV